MNVFSEQNLHTLQSDRGTSSITEHYKTTSHAEFYFVDDAVEFHSKTIRCRTCGLKFTVNDQGVWTPEGESDVIITFDAKTPEELLGQLVGACSSTRFWDALPSNYPYNEGIFLEQNGRALYDAAEKCLHGMSQDRLAQARRLVFQYAKEHLDKTDDKHETFAEDEVYVVWFNYTLGNWKALLSTTLPDGMYYEVTYCQDKDETYLDAYKKFENSVYPQSTNPS